MSATPPGSNGSPAASPAAAANGTADAATDVGDQKWEKIVIDYLKSRGMSKTEKTFRDELSGAPSKSGEVTIGQMVTENAAHGSKTGDGKNSLADGAAARQHLMNTLSGQPGPAHSAAALVSGLPATGAEEALALDPTDKHEGFRELEAWVEGSLDMYRPEFRPVLFPIFCHFYLDLVHQGFKDAAVHFYTTFSPSFSTTHASVLHRLSTLLLPTHVRDDDLAKRFRSEKYAVRMSQSGWDLLLGWLMEGSGGEAMGAGEGFSGEKGKRGRAAVLRVCNSHLRFDITSSNTTVVAPHAWEESTGLLSSLVPATNGASTSKDGARDPHSFNASRGDLKLGLPTLEDGLREEAERVLREEPPDGIHGQYDLSRYQIVPPASGHPAPSGSELPPHPTTFRTIDVKREVEKVRDARKRIRLDPAMLAQVGKDANGFDRNPQARAGALPSICAYTFNDAPDGVPCSTFSADSSLIAAGFSESYIRLWSLKGEKLCGLRSDFDLKSIKDANSLKKVKESAASTTRKLIGHSGPVYSLSFDPVAGSAARPRFLLSSSADATVRLWSLETMSNVVAYRGHQNPVWDVEWSPRGIYFATGSRDKTARLWSTDRISALRIFAGHLSDVDCIRFHPNSLYLATGSSDWTCRLWDVQQGTCVRAFVAHQGAVTTLAMSPDGRYMASAADDLAINLWDLGSGKRIKKMTGHTAAIHSLAFSAESSLLVSGSADWTVRCWDVKSAGGLPPKKGGLDDVALVDGFGLASRRISSSMMNDSGALPVNGLQDNDEEENIETTDLLATFPTKRTPIINVQFTPRNLCLVSGPFLPHTQR